MNDNKCQKMMGRGVEGGCGTQQKPCPPPCRASTTRGDIQVAEIGFYDQARKALTERCPFDSDEATTTNITNSRVSTLPVGLADSLSKYSHHSRKRQKKSSDSQPPTPHHHVRGASSTNIWLETEDYFRPVGLTDIDNLFHNSSLASLATHPSCFTIPPIHKTTTTTETTSFQQQEENVPSVPTVVLTVSTNAVVVEGTSGSDSQPVVVKEEKENEELPMETDGAEEASAGNVDGAEEASARNVDGAEEAAVRNVDETEEAAVRNVDVAERATGGAEANDGNVSPLKETKQSLASIPSSHARPSGIEWLLGSRNKLLLTSERPSKKRKFLGSDAGLDRLRVVCPSEGQGMPVCHVCCLGDLGEQSNQLLVCDSCKAAVHQKCYGVQELSVGLWLCSWCKYCGETGSELFSTPCFLCPKAGGALKPMAKDAAERKSSVPVRFIHLFCSQWMPEVYVEDTTKMEPIMNVGGIKETRKKLVCNICKVKYGACVRCSHGTCRTSFHPICARESRHRMEIWGKTGSETVELRAFCSKHSDFQNNSAPQSISHSSVSVGYDSSVSKNLLVKSLVNNSHKLKIGRKNGDQSMALIPTSDTISNKSGTSEVSLEQEASVPVTNTMPESECHDAQSSVSLEPLNVSKKTTMEGNNDGNMNPSDSQDFVRVLKKLVDRGKVSLIDVALETGIAIDSLAATLAGDRPSLFPHLHCKIVKWLRSNAYMGNPHGGSSSPASLMARVAGPDGANGVPLEGSDNSEAVPLKSIPLRKSTSKIRIMKDNKVTSSKQTAVQLKDNAIGVGDVNTCSLAPNGDMKEYGNGSGSPFGDGDSCPEDKDDKEKVSPKHSGYDDLGSSIEQSVRPEVELANGNLSETRQANAHDDSVRVGVTNSNGEHHISSIDAMTSVVPNLLSVDSASCTYIHPFIRKRLMRLQNGPVVRQENVNHDLNGLDERDSSSINSNKKVHSPSVDPDISSALKLEQLVVAKKMGILDLSPEDEVEGELIYFQNKLIDHAVTSRRFCDNLIFRVIKALPQELDAERKQRWDSVLVNQYISGLREAKKQGRKERRHKEAQAILAAATAAAAASSRISSFRKDSNDEACHQEVGAIDGRTAPYSQLIPRAKETLSRLAVPRASSEKPSDILQLKSFMNEHQQLCDICRRSETMLNAIFVCCNCKVAVHFGCYRGVKDHVGPWYCELCEELLPFRSPRCLPVQSQEKSAVAAQCGLCGGSTGAFRKSTDGQWVHAFCAEWLLESTYRRGQPNLVEGMETILKGRDFCCICSRRFGLCIKCNYGNCQSTFHPTCARNAGLYMHVKTGGGKLLHKAYCDKHSLEQREKAETQQHGPEALKAVKQIRVELERVRLLCERIIKREKVKRELIICSHNILASKRDSVAFSMLVRSPFFLPDVSSESATTSLRGHVDDNRSCSEAMQRSEDITVDSAVSGKHRDMLPVPMDIDQRTDDSSTSQHLGTRDPPDRLLFSGKQLPRRPASIASQNLAEEEERRAKSRKHTETFQKELVMTSDQASVQNQRLPKGFVYVPIVCLPKEKPAVCERGSHELLEPDG